MNVLPKFLYLFQTLPIFSVPQKFFNNLNSSIRKFIWNNKTLRVKLKTLHMAFKKGGLQLPDFLLYFWVAQMRAMNSTAPPAWIQIEKYHAGEIPLDKALFIPLTYVIREVNNPFTRHTSKLGFEIKKKYKWLLPLYNNTPFHNNPTLPEILRDGITQYWYKKCIQVFGDLYEEDILLTFEQLRTKFSLPVKHLNIFR